MFVSLLIFICTQNVSHHNACVGNSWNHQKSSLQLPIEHIDFVVALCCQAVLRVAPVWHVSTLRELCPVFNKLPANHKINTTLLRKYLTSAARGLSIKTITKDIFSCSLMNACQHPMITVSLPWSQSDLTESSNPLRLTCSWNLLTVGGNSSSVIFSLIASHQVLIWSVVCDNTIKY